MTRDQRIRKALRDQEKAARLAALHARWDAEDQQLRADAQTLIESQTPEQRRRRADEAIAKYGGAA